MYWKEIYLNRIIFLLMVFFFTFSALQGSEQPFAGNEKKPVIVFLITVDSLNYEAHFTIPSFAATLKKENKYDVYVLTGRGSHGANRFPDFDPVKKADLLIVFSRRIALPHDQMNTLKEYLRAGKPLLGIRTANHAFTTRTPIEKGFEDWPEFVAEVLGCENRGYGPVEPGTEVNTIPEQRDHPILRDVHLKSWHSDGNIYKVAPLTDHNATILLTGRVNGLNEPIAWTRMAGRSKVFYTSLGHPSDFKQQVFLTILQNAISWALEN